MTGSGVKGVPADPAVRRILPDEWQVYRQVRLTALAQAPDAFMSTLERGQGFGEGIWRPRLGPPTAGAVPAWGGRRAARAADREGGGSGGENVRSRAWQ